MAKFLLRLEDGLYQRITEKAAFHKRSLNKHIEYIIERDLATVEKAGVVKDGNVYWNSPEGIEQSR